MSSAGRPKNPHITCECGCGRTGPRRGTRNYVRSCYERWRRAGYPDTGPPPPPVKLSEGAPVEEAEQARRQREKARDAWATTVVEQVAAAQVEGEHPAPPPGWDERAACRTFTPDDDQDDDADPWFPASVATEDVLQVCDSCPVRAACLVHALTTPEKYGVWGGRSPEDLTTLRRRLRESRAKIRRRADRGAA